MLNHVFLRCVCNLSIFNHPGSTKYKIIYTVCFFSQVHESQPESYSDLHHFKK